MNIATLLFTYNRSYHTEQVIKALRKNVDSIQKLFVFQDGLKKDGDKYEWKKVNNLIEEIDWCEREIIVSEYNKGLANSIVSGINYIFNDYDAVVVLEDDCVPTANFIGFMNQCFEKYRDNKRVYSISGYSWPIRLEKCQYDVYACGRISSWGWGTWKDRWKIYKKDYEIIRRMKQKSETSIDLAVWGMDLEDTVVGNIRGYCDSWAVFWALNVISEQGICISPYQSLIKNIGMDGSGVHCGVTKQYDVKCIDEERKNFYLPDKVDILDETKKAFASLYGSYTAISNISSEKKSILVYGAGEFYLKNEKRINENYYVEKFVDKYKKGFLAGREIIRPDEIRNCLFHKLLIMIGDRNEAVNVKHFLEKEYGVSEEKIQIGFSV